MEAQDRQQTTDLSSRALRHRIALALSQTYNYDDTDLMNRIFDYISAIEDYGNKEICLSLIPQAFKTNPKAGEIKSLDRLFRWVKDGANYCQQTTI